MESESKILAETSNIATILYDHFSYYGYTFRPEVIIGRFDKDFLKLILLGFIYLVPLYVLELGPGISGICKGFKDVFGMECYVEHESCDFRAIFCANFLSEDIFGGFHATILEAKSKLMEFLYKLACCAWLSIQYEEISIIPSKDFLGVGNWILTFPNDVYR
ncbi:hypothetical protein VNO77_04004 [Canavalia gladiata]|uniref:Uncharacterized protein n=1 Tax=Canavalia gladiata TaxID=3824 RepID=A0AAN9N0Y0_CANGL